MSFVVLSCLSCCVLVEFLDNLEGPILEAPKQWEAQHQTQPQPMLCDGPGSSFAVASGPPGPTAEEETTVKRLVEIGQATKHLPSIDGAEAQSR